jgi:hypothetical protein
MTTKRGETYAIIFGEKNSSLVFPLGQPRSFGHHLMMWVSRMVTEILQLPSNDGVMLDGNQIFSIATYYTPLFNDNQIFFQSPKKAWGDGHEMTITTKERGKLSGKQIENKQ